MALDGEPQDTVPTTTADALKAVVDDVQRLVRAEVALAKAEVAAQVQSRAAALGMLVAAGLLGLYALHWLTFAMYAGWRNLVPSWAAALLSAAVLLLIVGALVGVGVRTLRQPVTPPQRAIESSTDAVALAKERLSAARARNRAPVPPPAPPLAAADGPRAGVDDGAAPTTR